ncbi:MAG TPA: ATP-binding protein [Limnobacter sp.]|uniref:ATP-binding protein n=1 Tax=Limnobacter sp. TaxID=2003368 RepID=UPI002ED8D5E0
MASHTDIVSKRTRPDDASLEHGVVSQTGHKNMLHLIHLRWLAVLGQIATILVATLVLGIHLPMAKMITVLVVLIAFNAGSHLRWHDEASVTNQALFLALMVDVATLTALLYFSGGTNNPFAFLFLLQVILSAVLLKASSAWLFMLITTYCLAFLSVFHEPLELPPTSAHLMPSLYLQGLLVCFILIAALLVFFITRISSNLRAGDAYLANIRQRAVEEEHIVRMGLLASGAAHELGTPLATMAVILNDWKRMPQFRDDADLQGDLEDLQNQLMRCKGIVSGILMSAGETRGESSKRTTLDAFVHEVAEQWKQSQPTVRFECVNRVEQSIPVVFESALKQTLFNVLDNAAEVSPQWVRLEASCIGDQLHLTVSDQGPGFQPEILDNIGKPYNSTKGRPGGGLGLFLAVNVVRTLGGTVSPINRAAGGAEVHIQLPLKSIELSVEKLDVR